MIHPQSKAELDKHLFSGCNIVELGDQFCDWNEKVQGKRTPEYFTPLGVNIQSIDWHGNNGAIKLDLSKVVNDKFEADLLTDFGTLEHIKDTYNALTNCFNFTRIGGKMIHVNPDKTYVKHGYYYFTERFWLEFANACGYAVERIYSDHPYDKSNPALEVYAVLVKQTISRMCSREKFNKLKKYLGKND